MQFEEHDQQLPPISNFPDQQSHGATVSRFVTEQHSFSNQPAAAERAAAERAAAAHRDRPHSPSGAAVPEGPRPLEPMDPQVTTIQPGGGMVMSLELAWGSLRRALLRRLRPGYVAAMRNVRRGERGGIPFDPVDSRDVKYYANQGTYYWDRADDPFRWRDRLPFVRVGLAELIIIGGSFIWATAVAFFLWWPLGVILALVTACVIWFFRDPRRAVPAGPGEVVSPADGLVVEVQEIEDPLIGPAIEIGIFLSIFNVHVNRAPIAGRVLGIEYRRGKFLNALRPASAKENEQLEVRIEESEAPYRLMRVRQITGQFARRIVCWLRPGDALDRGEVFGMIKLGSRTELVLPRETGLELHVSVGQKVKAGSTLMARYASPRHGDASGGTA